MKVQISDAIMKELERYDELLVKASKSRSIYVPFEKRGPLAGLYTRIVGNTQACKGCNNAWVIRLGGWYVEHKEAPKPEKPIRKKSNKPKNSPEGKKNDKRTI